LLFHLIRNQPIAKLAQNRKVKPWILQRQSQLELPIDPAAHRIRRLPVRQIFRKLQNGNQYESSSIAAWVTRPMNTCQELRSTKGRDHSNRHSRLMKHSAMRGVEMV
jgi:hypothetical protein